MDAEVMPGVEKMFKRDIRRLMVEADDPSAFLITFINSTRTDHIFYPWLLDLCHELEAERGAALPAPVIRPWWAVLEVSPTATRDAITTSYRRLARERHPDAGGSTEAMAELNAARKATYSKPN